MREGGLRKPFSHSPSVESMRALTNIQNTTLGENNLSNLVGDVLIQRNMYIALCLSCFLDMLISFVAPYVD